MSDTTTGGPTTVVENLTAARAAEIRDALLTQLGSGGDLELDLSAVTEVDVAGLQLLCAAHRSAVAAGRELVVAGASEALREALRVSGLATAAGCDMPCPWQETSDG